MLRTFATRSREPNPPTACGSAREPVGGRGHTSPRRSGRVLRRLLAMLGLLCLGPVVPTIASAEFGAPGRCVSTRVRGVDVGHGDGIRIIRVSRGLAQTFVATDTLVRAVSVWVSASRPSLDIPMRLLILRTDADGRPMPEAAIADGGEIDTGESAGALAARFTFTFDPPAMLPAPGRYALAVVPARCNVIPMLVDGDDDYPDGDLWELAARQCNSPLSSVSGHLSGSDLTFRIEFCEGGTATAGRTWGELKTLYH